MMPLCAKCKKAVYPTEKLNCLDAVWHKLCFKCEVCDLQLNMKNYKGYKRLPYCNTHYPTTNFVAVADTPENRRISKQEASQSNVVYHNEASETTYSAVGDSDKERREMVQKSMPDIRNTPATTRQADKLEKSRKPPKVRVPPTDERDIARQGSKVVYRALYDYTAADDDEVSFMEGDRIVDCTIIDEGWSEGKVEKSGQYGMMPSNYLEKI